MSPSSNAILAAFASTTLVSLAPNIILVLFPHYGSGEGEHSPILSLGQALAAGGLLGDVFLHVIPHASSSGDGHHDDHDSHHQHHQHHDDELHHHRHHHGDEVGMWILLGFSIFLVTDMIIRGLSSSSHHKHSGHNHHDDNKQSTSNLSKNDDHDDHQHKTSTILLNLAADALHNFTDGLAIGASFANLSLTGVDGSGSSSSSNLSFWTLLQSRGGLATLSILCHEIPHELGDFAILVKQGFSKQQAILAQFGTALAAMVGTGVGLGLQDYAGGDQLILITAGGFVYLAAVTIIPDILDDHGGRRTVQFRLGQLLCFAIGIGFMYGVSMLEEMDPHGHHHHHGHLDHVDLVVAAATHHHGHDHHDMDHHHDHHQHHDHHDHSHGEL